MASDFGFGFSAAPRNAFDRLPFRFLYDLERSYSSDTLVSGEYQAIQDLSGSGLGATAVSSATRPVATTSGGRRALQCASGKLMRSLGVSMPAGCCYFFAGTFGVGSGVLLWDGGLGGRQGLSKNGSSQPILYGTNVTGLAGAAVGDVLVVGAAIFGASSTRMILRPQAAAPQDVTQNPDGPCQTLADLYVGGTYTNSNNWDGKLCMLAGVTVTPSESALQAALTSLQLRYGIATA